LELIKLGLIIEASNDTETNLKTATSTLANELTSLENALAAAIRPGTGFDLQKKKIDELLSSTRNLLREDDQMRETISKNFTQFYSLLNSFSVLFQN